MDFFFCRFLYLLSSHDGSRPGIGGLAFKIKASSSSLVAVFSRFVLSLSARSQSFLLIIGFLLIRLGHISDDGYVGDLYVECGADEDGAAPGYSLSAYSDDGTVFEPEEKKDTAYELINNAGFHWFFLERGWRARMSLAALQVGPRGAPDAFIQAPPLIESRILFCARFRGDSVFGFP